MSLSLTKLTPDEWVKMSEIAHEAMFSTLKDSKLERIDAALLGISEQNVAVAYVTIKELDSETCYWQYGGVFGPHRGKEHINEFMDAIIAYGKEHYKRIGFRVESDNWAMLRVATRYHIPITGIRVFKGKVLVEHVLEFEEK